MKSILKILLIVIPIIVLVVIGFLYHSLNTIIQKSVVTIGPRLTKAPVELADVNISLLSGKGSLDGLVIGNPEGFNTPSAFELEHLLVDLDLASLKSDTIVIRELTIQGPEVTIEGLDGKNLKKLQENVAGSGDGDKEEPAGEEPAGQSAEPGKKLIIKRLSVQEGRLNYSPGLLKGKSIPIPLPGFEMEGLGEDTGGLTVAQLTALILGKATESVVAVVKDSGKLISDGTAAALKGAMAGVDGAADIADKGSAAAAELAGKGGEAAAQIAGESGEAVKESAEKVGEEASKALSGVKKLLGGGDEE